MNKIIRVNKREILTFGVVNTVITRRGCPTVFFMKNLNTTVRRSQLIAKLRRTIGRTVIDKDNLKIIHRLRLERLYATWQKLPNVIYGNNHAHCWHIIRS